MVDERALKQNFFSKSHQISLSVHEDSIFPAHVSLYRLVCGSTDQAAHYHFLSF
jgi:hypothetical protein